MRARPILIVAAALLTACSDSTGSSAPTAVGVVSGSGQAAAVVQLAPAPLVVRVTDAGGDPVSGVTVHWAVASGGGSLTAASTATGADGLAQVQWMLGPRAEAQTVTATVEGLAPAVFTVTPAPGPFARVTLSPDSVEVGAVGLSVTLRATWLDAHDNSMGRPGFVVWTSLDQAVAGIESASTASEIHAVALAGGRARIVVRTVNNRADTAVFWVRQHPASITVTLRNPVVTEGDTTRALAEVRDPGGHLIPNPPLTWSTTDPSGATIDATGKITALRGDTLSVVATWGSATAAATLYVNGLFRVASMDAGGHHSCALNTAGQAFCWGWNQGGQLGVPATPGGASAVPVAVQTSARFTAVAASAWPGPQPAAGAGTGHSCGIATGGGLLCWGENGQGQLGREGTVATHVPAEVAGDRTWQVVSTGGRHTCGITTGQTYCWGLDDEGQVGAPTADLCAPGTGPGGPCARAPQRVAGGMTFTQISTGAAHTCALTADGAAYCWGRNDSGQLGNGTTTRADVPVAVLGGHTFVSISAGGAHTCARTVGWSGYCWGANGSFQLGNGTTTPATVPALANVSSTSLQSGWAHNCFAADDGVVYCWGANDHGQQGNSKLAPAPVPIGMGGGFRFTSVSTAGLHTCGVRAADGMALCWGDNDGGKLGFGAGPDHPLPRPVRAP